MQQHASGPSCWNTFWSHFCLPGCFSHLSKALGLGAPSRPVTSAMDTYSMPEPVNKEHSFTGFNVSRVRSICFHLAPATLASIGLTATVARSSFLSMRSEARLNVIGPSLARLFGLTHGIAAGFFRVGSAAPRGAAPAGRFRAAALAEGEDREDLPCADSSANLASRKFRYASLSTTE